MKTPLLLAATAGSIVFPYAARADVFLTEEAATAVLFPGEKFTLATIELTPAQVKTIEERSDESVRATLVRRYRSMVGKRVYIDQVLGKHEMITYAVGINPDGHVAGIEILEYRESYGGQIRQTAWRAQFKDKHAGDAVKVGKDIVNISGASLSSAHVAAGVRRILVTDDTLK